MHRRIIIASIKGAPKQPERQNTDEREFKAPPNYEGADIRQRKKLSFLSDMMLEIMPFTPARRHCGQDSAAASQNGAQRRRSPQPARLLCLRVGEEHDL